jgi:hypothetical protein
VNERFRQERRALTLLVALLASNRRALLHRQQAGAASELADHLADRITSALLELYSWQDTVEALRAEYFEGVSPLLPATEEQLGWLVANAERLAQWCNDYPELPEPESGQSSAPIDLASTRRDAEPAVEALIHSLVTVARTEAHEMMGEHRHAVAFAQRNISPPV